MAQASRQVAARRSRPAARRTRPLGPAHSRRTRVAPPRKGTSDVSDLKISWIGLGKLGLPMAARIAAAGRAVAGYDLDPQRAELAASRQIQVKAEAREALEGARVVFSSLPDRKELET